MGLEWTHSINLEIPNIRKYFWYEIVFKSPEGEQLTDEEVYKAFRNVLFASKAARVGPKNRILLLKDNDGEEVLQIKEDFIIRGGYDDFLRETDDGNFCCQIISLFKIKPFPEEQGDSWNLELIDTCKLTDDRNVGDATFSQLMAQMIFSDFDPDLAFAPADVTEKEDDHDRDEDEKDIPVRERTYRYDSYRLSHFFEDEATGKVHLAVIVQNMVEDYTLLEYMAIVREAFDNDDNSRQESLDQAIDEAIQFQVVYNEELDVFASIDGIRKDARPNSCMTVTANPGGKRTYNKRLTIKTMYEKQGLNITIDEQPICFQNKHEKDGYLNVAFDSGPDMTGVDWLEKRIIVPELWTMTGTVDPQKQQYLAVANTDRYRMENSILAHAQKAIRFMFQKAGSMHLMFPLWLVTVGNSMKCDPDLIPRGRDNLKLKKVAIKNWTIMCRSELEAVGAVKSQMMQICNDNGIKMKAPSEIMIENEEKNDPKSWVAKLPNAWEQNKSSLLWLILPLFREDLYREIKKRCIDIHLPIFVQTESRFPQSDRDRWIEKYSKNRVNDIITKLGAPKQTRNWTLTGYQKNKTLLIIAIHESNGFFSFVYNHQERKQNQYNTCNILKAGQPVVKLTNEYMDDGQRTFMEDIADSINTILTKLKNEPDEILLLAGGQFDVHIFNQMLEDSNKAKWSNEKGMINQRDHGLLMKYLDGANLRVTMAKIEENDRRFDQRKEISGNHICIAPTKEFATRGAAMANIRPIRVHLINRSTTMTHYMLQTTLYDLQTPPQHSIHRKKKPELWPMIWARKICNRLEEGIIKANDFKEHFNEHPEGIIFI